MPEAGIYPLANDSQQGLAEEWLRKKDQARSDAFQASQAEAAQRAATAAERAASAAESAAATTLLQARTAKQALIIVIVADIMAAISIATNIFIFCSNRRRDHRCSRAKFIR